MNIENAILDECLKLVRRQQQTVRQNNAHRKRYEKVTGLRGGQPKHTPPHWSIANCFNPYTVRRQAHRIAESIQKRLESNSYEPLPAIIREVKKPDGTKRPLSIFPVADAALGTLCFRRIIARNQHRLSPFSFAFRRDIGIHEAIETLRREISNRNRFWVVEFDFSKYFDTISHTYLERILTTHFKITATEHQVLSATLRCRRAFRPEDYATGRFSRTSRGIPQGNSLSLFLANAACHELDLAIQRTPATFCRYADDILLLCRSSGEADDVAELVLDHCKSAGLSINFTKSDGISRFGPEYVAGRNSGLIDGKTAIDYLGHRFQYRTVTKRNHPAKEVVRRLSIRERSFLKIKVRLANIIYCHLLRYPRRKALSLRRIDIKNGVDWDLVTCINDLRDYIYGGLPEDELQKALADRSTRLHLNRGVFAFYPLVDDVEQLKSLDGWLLNALARAVLARAHLLAAMGIQNYAPLSRAQLLSATWYNHDLFPTEDNQTIKNDVRLPSLVRVWKYGKRCLNAFNLGDFPFRDHDS